MNQFPPFGPQKDKFTPELRILAASLLSMVVILLWAKYFGPKPPVRSPQQDKSAVSAPAVPGTPSSAGVASGTAPPPSPANPTVHSATTPATSSIADRQERTIVVENSLYRVEFSNRGAVVKSWQLKKYKDDAKPQKPLDVVHAQAAQYEGGWPFAVALDDAQLEAAANSGLYQVSTDSNELRAPADAQFSWSDG